MRTNVEKRKLFYGWWIVGAGFFISLYSGGVIFYGFTALFEPIASEFEWSYVQVSLAASLRGMEMGILAPLVGILVDRWGPRRLIVVGAVVMGSGLILLSRVNSLAMFYGAFAVIAIGISAMSGTVMLTSVVNWFRRKVALATGIMVSGLAIGGLLIPVITVLIDECGWRQAMVILGLCAWVVVIPLALLFRHKPEHYGHLPDGEVSGAVVVEEKPFPARGTPSGVPAAEVETRRAFWHISLATMLQMLIMSATSTHIMPYLTSINISRSVASLVAGVVPLTSIGGRLGFGWLGDRLDKKVVAALGSVLITLGMLCFGGLITGWMWLLLPFLVFFSTGWGGSVVVRVVLIREYYSRGQFGRTYGFLVGISTLGHVAGAPLAGWVFDQWGAYFGAWFAFAALAVVSLVIFLTIPPSQRKMPPADKLREEAVVD
jgi:MFS family permease